MLDNHLNITSSNAGSRKAYSTSLHMVLKNDYAETITANQDQIDARYGSPENKKINLINALDGTVACEDYNKLSWYDRTFSPMNSGSLRGSIITLLSTALGSGILSLPYVVAESGLVFGGLFIIIGGCFCLLSMYLLMRASFKTGYTVYSDLVKHCFGEKISLLFEITIIIYAFGAFTIYQITISKFIPDIFKNLSIISQSYTWTSNDAALQMIIVFLMVFPITLIRNLHGLRYGTMIGVTAVSYILGVVLIESFWQIPSQQGCPVLFNYDISLISCFAITTFAFSCHTNIFPLRSELSRPMERRMRKIFNRVVFMEFLMYFGMGVVGYLSSMQSPQPLITDRIPVPVFGTRDTFMLFGRIAMTINLIIGIPVNLNPCRRQILNLLKKTEFTYASHISSTLIILASSTTIAILFPNVSAAFSFIGGTCGTLVSISFPIFLHVKTNPDRLSHPYNIMMMTLGIVMTLLGFAGAIIGLVHEITPSPSIPCQSSKKVNNNKEQNTLMINYFLQQLLNMIQQTYDQQSFFT